MLVKFDHLVHFTNRPEEARNDFQAIGFKTIQGGNHPNWGTYNCLSYFPDLRYIEWIGIKDLEVAKTSDNILIQQIVHDSLTKGEGFSQLAFRTNDIIALQGSLNEKGFQTIGPFPGSRKKADGTTISWSMLFIKEEPASDLRYPFFHSMGNFR